MLHSDVRAAVDFRAWSHAACWLRQEMLESLTEVNHRCLGLLAEQALSHPPQTHPTLRQVGELWRTLDERARWRAAACPYLLLDAGFAEPQRWHRLGSPGVADAQSAAYASFFTVPQTVTVARMVFVYAWSLISTHAAGARVVLGIHPHSARLLGACTVPQVHELAERHAAWLRPRWLGRASIWREMLLAAAQCDGVALERSRMQGLQMLAAEAWDAAARGGGRNGPGTVPAIQLQ